MGAELSVGWERGVSGMARHGRWHVAFSCVFIGERIVPVSGRSVGLGSPVGRATTARWSPDPESLRSFCPILSPVTSVVPCFAGALQLGTPCDLTKPATPQTLGTGTPTPDPKPVPNRPPQHVTLKFVPRFTNIRGVHHDICDARVYVGTYFIVSINPILKTGRLF
jgi:hypothetical protein